MSEQSTTIEESGRANYIRVTCLLALAIQAAAEQSLFDWLVGSLRGPTEDADDPVQATTEGFAKKFAACLPAPPGWGLNEAQWVQQLCALLLRLQTNLFYVTDTCIGIFPSTWLLEHSCAPNAEVRKGPRDPSSLAVRALKPIRSGEVVTFCYCEQIATEPSVERRRPAIQKELGFYCRCARCEEEAAALDAPG